MSDFTGLGQLDQDSISSTPGDNQPTDFTAGANSFIDQGMGSYDAQDSLLASGSTPTLGGINSGNNSYDSSSSAPVLDAQDTLLAAGATPALAGINAAQAPGVPAATQQQGSVGAIAALVKALGGGVTGGTGATAPTGGAGLGGLMASTRNPAAQANMTAAIVMIGLGVLAFVALNGSEGHVP
jgi:hypothetical protein